VAYSVPVVFFKSLFVNYALLLIATKIESLFLCLVYNKIFSMYSVPLGHFIPTSRPVVPNRGGIPPQGEIS